MILATKIGKAIALIVLLVLVYFLSQVFSGRLILAQTFSLGSFTIHYYGLIIASAVASGFYLAEKRMGRYGIKGAAAQNLLFWVIVGGFTGARLYHVLSSAGYYFEHPVDMIKVWQGGLSIYGAILGGLLAHLIYKKVINYQLSIINYLNWLTPSLILGQIIGRFGNLFNYEAFGYPTNLPWKMFVPENFRPSLYLNSEYFHPWFLYEQIGLLVVFIITELKVCPAPEGPSAHQAESWPSALGYGAQQKFNLNSIPIQTGALFLWYIYCIIYCVFDWNF